MNVLTAIIIAGLVAGALDIISALASFVPRGATEIGILQFIASGLIGKAALTGGWATGLLGLAVHFGLTTIMATVYVIASLRFDALRRAPWIAGTLYGLAVYFFMNYVAVPLSNVASWTPGKGWAMVGGILAHCVYVGLPIALLARHYLGPGSSPASPAVSAP